MSKGKTSRRKGRDWQSSLALRWRSSGLYPDAASTQGAQVRSRREIGKTPPDVEGTPWWVEATHSKAASPLGKLRQATEEAASAGDDRPPLAVVRPHGSGPDGAVVVMRLTDFEALILAQREGWESQ